MDTLKVGIIGLGVGFKHISAFASHNNCEIAVLCDFSEEKLLEVKERYPHARLTRDANEVLDDPAISLVSIASFDNYHFGQTVRALQNRKHVLVEKPLCLCPEEAIQLRKILRKNKNLKISSNLNLRTCPRFKWLRHAIASGQMGEIFYYEGDYLWGRIHKLTDGWRKDIPFYSIIHGAAVHMVDLLLWLVEMKPVQIQGYANQIATKGSSLRYNDFAALLMRFENGMAAKISANGGCVHPHFHKVVVYGTKQTFVHSTSGARLISSRDPKHSPLKIHEEYPDKDKGDIITSFVDSILHENSAAIVPQEDVFRTMSVCFAAEESIKRGEPVTIKYI